jgi:ATP-binding cassette subfamily F protein 3
MLLRPSNTLLLDEPTNHLDLDSKEVLLDALIAYGGTLVFVSHDRYFVERLATKIIEVGHGTAVMYPGTYTEFLWHKDNPQSRGPAKLEEQSSRHTGQKGRAAGVERAPHRPVSSGAEKARPRRETASPISSHREHKRADAEARRQSRIQQERRLHIDRLEAQIAETEQAIREIERAMAAPGFYDDRTAAQPVIDRHQALMWQVGDLMQQWEELQNMSLSPATDH